MLGDPRIPVAVLALTSAVALIYAATSGNTGEAWIVFGVWTVGCLVAVALGVASLGGMRPAGTIGGPDMLQGAVARTLARSTTLEDTARRIMHALGTELDFDLALAWRADTADQRLRLLAFWHAPMVDAAEFEADSWDVEFERGQGVLGEVWEYGTPVEFRDIAASKDRFRRGDLLATIGLKHVLFVPVKIGDDDRPIGVIECFSRSAAPLDARQLLLIEDIGRQVGIAYERADHLASLDASEKRRREVLAAMLRGEQETRARLASDLHDDTVQVMAATLISLDRLERATAGGESSHAAAAARTASQTLREAMERTRRLMFELRPVLLHEEGLNAAIGALTQDIAGECGFEYETHITVARLPEELEELVYRICQEALANIRKHARARNVTIDMQADEEMLLCTIADDGVGFDLQRALDRNKMRLHIGLETMIERVELAGGAMHFDAGSGEGTTIRFHVPLSSVAEPAPVGA